LQCWLAQRLCVCMRVCVAVQRVGTLNWWISVVIGQRRRSIRRELPWEVHREIHVVCASCCPECDDCVCVWVGGWLKTLSTTSHSLSTNQVTHSLSRMHARVRAYARALPGSSALTLLVSYRGRRGTVIRLPSQPNDTTQSWPRDEAKVGTTSLAHCAVSN
jgi:hypothetical protein